MYDFYRYLLDIDGLALGGIGSTRFDTCLVVLNWLFNAVWCGCKSWSRKQGAIKINFLRTWKRDEDLPPKIFDQYAFFFLSNPILGLSLELLEGLPKMSCYKGTPDGHFFSYFYFNVNKIFLQIEKFLQTRFIALMKITLCTLVERYNRFYSVKWVLSGSFFNSFQPS